MGRIEYIHNGLQTNGAVIFNNDGIKIAEARRSFNGTHWILDPKNIEFKNAILRSLDILCIYY